MLVDGNTVLAKPNELENVNVSAEIVDKEIKKINGFTYKNKVTNADDGDIARTITKSKHINIKELIMSKTKVAALEMAEILTPRGSELKLTTERQSQLDPLLSANEERSFTVRMCVEVERYTITLPMAALIR